MSFGYCTVGQPSLHGVDAADEGRLTFASLFQTEIREQLDITISDIR